MRGILKTFAVNTIALYLVTQWFSGLSVANGWQGLIVAGVGLTLVNSLARPIINLLLLPINLITFGLFKWVSSALTLYITTLLVPGFSVAGFYFAGLATKWIDIPKINFSGFLSYIAFSFILSALTSLVHWLVK